jgi:uncharacterized protein (DUF2147 family)
MSVRRHERHTVVIGVIASAMLAGQLAPPVGAASAAEPTPVGVWRQFDDRKGDLRSVIRIDLVNGELVGTIVKAVLRPGEPANPTCEKCPGETKDKPIEGLRFLWGLKGAGRDWDGGRVLDPEDGKVYRVKVRLSEDGQSLDVRGYVGISLLGRTQRWVRAR